VGGGIGRREGNSGGGGTLPKGQVTKSELKKKRKVLPAVGQARMRTGKEVGAYCSDLGGKEKKTKRKKKKRKWKGGGGIWGDQATGNHYKSGGKGPGPVMGGGKMA